MIPKTVKVAKGCSGPQTPQFWGFEFCLPQFLRNPSLPSWEGFAPSIEEGWITFGFPCRILLLRWSPVNEFTLLTLGGQGGAWITLKFSSNILLLRWSSVNGLTLTF